MTDFLIETRVHSERISYRRSSPSLSLLQGIGRCFPHHTRRCGCSLAAPTVLIYSATAAMLPAPSARPHLALSALHPPLPLLLTPSIFDEITPRAHAPPHPCMTSHEAHRSILLMESALPFFVRHPGLTKGHDRTFIHPSFRLSPRRHSRRDVSLSCARLLTTAGGQVLIVPQRRL